MSLRDVHGGRALVLRLVLAELIARPGEGPLAPRFAVFRARETTRFDPRTRPGARPAQEEPK